MKESEERDPGAIIGIWMPTAMHEHVRTAAREDERTVSSFSRKALRDALERLERRRASVA